MNSPKIRCDKCGQEMTSFQEGRTQGLLCRHCGWSVVTTYTPPIQLDKNSYQVRIEQGNYLDATQVKAVAHVIKENFLIARSVLKKDHPLIFDGNAREVKIIRDSLRAAGVIVKIQPEFPW